jgi:hypothetical protein
VKVLVKKIAIDPPVLVSQLLFSSFLLFLAEEERYQQNGQQNGDANGHRNDYPAPSASRSVASVGDLLDTGNTFDDSASYPNLPNYGQPDPGQAAFAAYSQQSYPGPAAAPPQAPPHQQMQPYYAEAPQQYPAAPQPYPTQAPPQPPQPYGQQPPQQQQYQQQQYQNYQF